MSNIMINTSSVDSDFSSGDLKTEESFQLLLSRKRQCLSDSCLSDILLTPRGILFWSKLHARFYINRKFCAKCFYKLVQSVQTPTYSSVTVPINQWSTLWCLNYCCRQVMRHHRVVNSNASSFRSHKLYNYRRALLITFLIKHIRECKHLNCETAFALPSFSNFYNNYKWELQFRFSRSVRRFALKQ